MDGFVVAFWLQEQQLGNNHTGYSIINLSRAGREHINRRKHLHFTLYQFPLWGQHLQDPLHKWFSPSGGGNRCHMLVLPSPEKKHKWILNYTKQTCNKPTESSEIIKTLIVQSYCTVFWLVCYFLHHWSQFVPIYETVLHKNNRITLETDFSTFETFPVSVIRDSWTWEDLKLAAEQQKKWLHLLCLPNKSTTEGRSDLWNQYSCWQFAVVINQSCFHTWPLEDVWRIVSVFCRVFLSHMHNAAGDSPVTTNLRRVQVRVGAWCY